MISDGDSLVGRRKIIARNIRIRRRVLELTQRDLADGMGISPDRIGRIEKGQASLNFEEVPILCEILGIENQESLCQPEYIHRF